MRPTQRVVAGEQGLQIEREGATSLLMRWDEVYAVSVSKIDAINSVVTYLTFDYDWGEYVEVDDQMEGFGQMLSDLPTHLPITPADWRAALQTTSSQDAPVTIYRRLVI